MLKKEDWKLFLLCIGQRTDTSLEDIDTTYTCTTGTPLRASGWGGRELLLQQQTAADCTDIIAYIVALLVKPEGLVTYFVSASNSSVSGSTQGGGLTSSPSTPPPSRGVVSSPFTVLSSRPEHAFSHIHPQGHQVSAL